MKIKFGWYIAVWLLMGSVLAKAQDKPLTDKFGKPCAAGQVLKEELCFTPAAAVPLTISPLTQDESDDLNAARVDKLQADNAYQKKIDEANQQLLQTEEFKRQQAAQQHLNQLVDQVFQARKLVAEKDASLCDGPDQRAACAPLKRRGLKLMSVPKPAEAKK